jgi:hypothetical protein
MARLRKETTKLALEDMYLDSMARGKVREIRLLQLWEELRTSD